MTTNQRYPTPESGPLVVFDVETQKLFEEVGGRQASKLGLSIAVSYDADAGVFRDFNEETVGELVEQIFSARLVVGYNTLKFDYAVLRPYTDRKFNRVPTLDSSRSRSSANPGPTTVTRQLTRLSCIEMSM